MKVTPKIDLTNAYLQLPLNEQSKLCTVNTNKGLLNQDAFWGGISSCYVPEADGVGRDATSGLLYR